EQARAAERAFARSSVASPLQGIPLAVKDLVYTRGIRTTAGSRILEDFVPDYDATVMEKLESAGAVLLGKLNLLEFAMGGTMTNVRFGATRNPWNTAHFPGGSSSGSGASVAAGLAMGAIGTDTGGSIRGPAHNCGILGLKPTYGRVSRHGVVPLSWSLDHVGPMTRTAEDCALMLQAIAGQDPRELASSAAPVDDYTAPLKDGVRGLRLGVLRKDAFRDLSTDVAAAIESALGLFGELGARSHEVSLAHDLDARTLYTAIAYPEATAYHLEWMKTRIQEYGPNCRNRLEQGLGLLAVQYVQAQRVRKVLYQDYMALFEGADLLVAPTAPTTAPRLDQGPGGEVPGRPAALSVTNPANLTGLPALALPIGFGSDGLPLSLQLIARPFDEAAILRAAHAYQQAAGWHTRRPNL
ncbi:MAG: Asp-tRNA(Asn)/Glu-tRNA(Gln) amidotransferase subunit GatA, partial [Chloroflexi bacterium]|nr:Asp-tRNA(Asn)/Glu-tRNA(Gln) amidotransferase subunit GatA [Chloroflexota bacterium]